MARKHHRQREYIEFNDLTVDYNDGDIVIYDNAKNFQEIFPLNSTTNMIGLCTKGHLTMSVYGIDTRIKEDDILFCPPNIKIDNGKLIKESADSIILAGYTMPGLNQDLGTDFLPDSFTVEADVKDFAMKDTYTFATNEFFSDIDVDKLNSVNDLIISGLVGLRPSLDNEISINPLIPAGQWSYFCLDGIVYHEHVLTILWDETGLRYGQGRGLTLLVDGRRVANRPTLGKLVWKL